MRIWRLSCFSSWEVHAASRDAAESIKLDGEWPKNKDLVEVEELDLTADDVRRLGEIAGELEHAPERIRRFFDQDGRDARYLRILQERIKQLTLTQA